MIYFVKEHSNVFKIVLRFFLFFLLISFDALIKISVPLDTIIEQLLTVFPGLLCWQFLVNWFPKYVKDSDIFV